MLGHQDVLNHSRMTTVMGETKGKGEGEENARVKEEERVRQENIGEWERGRKKGSRERKGSTRG